MMFLTSFLPFWLYKEEEVAPPENSGGGLAVFLGVCYAASLYGALYSPKEGGWYSRLIKPDWNPPNDLFGPIWLILYGCIAVAGWGIWRTGAFRAVPLAGLGFAAQLILNAIWTTLFFGMQAPLLGLIDLVALSILLIVLLLLYRQIDRVAALLWLPYLAWVLFATVLNARIWSLNS